MYIREMVKTGTTTTIELAVSAETFIIAFIGYCIARFRLRYKGKTKALKRNSILLLAVTIISAWFFIGTLINYMLETESGLHVEFEMFSERVSIFGFSFAKTSVLMWILTGIALVICLIFRFVIFPRFDPDKPHGIQNIVELAVEATENFTKNIVGEYSTALAPYMFSLALFMILSAISELFGCRPPTSDLTVTLAMGLITFALINYYGIKKKGIFGRIKGLAKPTPVIFPMKILSDIAVPVSLACRLFGNMIGGMIVMELLKSVLGGYAVGLPAVAGLYFNVFHPLIQTYIFIILSLTFINEAIE